MANLKLSGLIALCFAVWGITTWNFANLQWYTTSFSYMAATTLFIICALLSAMMATLCICTALKDLFHGYLGVFFVSALPAPLLAYAKSLIRSGSGAAVPVMLGFDFLFLALAAFASPIRST
ncbi:hypothetical protein AMAG_04254 [Allomyces macrogynus ATCC 38327]|uniref:Uncharacterized protein n=1 Tax=Allomyces macrogynus (strain ATCC 38327) TaxID=578462 RepID=A0A0L0S8E7_ALLM3|nr:hypothetical protein AMAG_04254 [Allomyces macrogynus ATCC 38327]|eukprot:KNE58701.1 hypothetical protein AMAG_04254 [Allomyces macrogynus ATCC 38327]